MTLFALAWKGLQHYRRTHAAVVTGVACAVAVLAGAWLVGASVRGSLEGLVTERLGKTDVVIGAENPFTGDLGDRLRKQPSLASVTGVAPIFALEGLVTHQSSSRRAGNVSVYGVDARFFAFHGVTVEPPSGTNAWLSPALAEELGTADADAVILRVTRPTDIPLDSLQSRKDDVGRSIRLRVQGTLPAASMGEFSLAPSQGPVRAIFVDLERLQRDLEQPGRAIALLLARGAAAPVSTEVMTQALDDVLDARDLGLTITSPAVLVESSSGVMSDGVVEAVIQGAGVRPEAVTPVLSWLANRISLREKSTPYSLVAGIGPAAVGDPDLRPFLSAPATTGEPPVVLNDWIARDLDAKVGETVEMEYYRWLDEGRLVTARASFRVAGIVPIRGLAADRRLAPPYPGITDSDSVADWDPPFPIDLKLVRQKDEEYWDQYRTTAKAFIPLETAQRLWGTRHGKDVSPY